jgi:hypothetical protein
MIPDINLLKLGEYLVRDDILKVKVKRRRGLAAAPFYFARDI